MGDSVDQLDTLPKPLLPASDHVLLRDASLQSFRNFQFVNGAFHVLHNAFGRLVVIVAVPNRIPEASTDCELEDWYPLVPISGEMSMSCMVRIVGSGFITTWAKLLPGGKAVVGVAISRPCSGGPPL